MKTKRTLLCIPLYLWAVLLVGLPILYVAGLSFFARDVSWGVSERLTLANYRMLLDPVYLGVFGRSLVTAAVSCGVTLLLGYPFAYGMAKAPARWRTILMILVVVPFWTSALIRTYGWIILLRANGPINAFLQWLGLTDGPLKLLYTDGAVLLGFVHTLLPLMILPCYTIIERMDWTTVEAARDLGAPPARAFFTVTLPLTAPGIFSGLTLTFVPCMGLFFLSDLLGGSKTVLAGNLIQDQMLRANNMPFGAALAVAMLALTAFVLYLQRRAGGDSTLL